MRDGDGPALDVHGTILNVAPVSTKYLSLVNSSVRKMRPAFVRKCLAVAVSCAGFAAELVKVWWHFSFPKKPGTRENALVGFVAVKVVVFAHAISTAYCCHAGTGWGPEA
jgi:hypothetical protein